MQDCQGLPAVKAMLGSARSILGYDLLALCLEGPREKLDDTAFAQPALYLAGLAAVEKLRAQDPAAVEGCSVAAGLSLGEYCALVFAGAMSFEDGWKVWHPGARPINTALTALTPACGLATHHSGLISRWGKKNTNLKQTNKQI